MRYAPNGNDNTATGYIALTANTATGYNALTAITSRLLLYLCIFTIYSRCL